jgi:O-antigen/teichoic acid export membrane protein
MSFFGPILPPTLDETRSPILRRALHRAKIIGNFAIVQAIVQVIGFGSGILIIRTLEQREYAYFTIANTMQGTINLLADIGISVGLISIGGRVWHDRRRFGQLINTDLRARKKLGGAAIIVVTPFLFFLLARNGAPLFYSTVLILLLLAGILIQLSLGVLGVVPRLRADIRRIQIIDFTGAIARLITLLALMFIFLSASVAIAVASATLFLQYIMLHRYVAGVIDLDVPPNPEDRQEIVRLIKHLAPNAIFYSVQGQITVFLISIFAHLATSVAEVGALGRLAMIFAVISNLLTNVFVPAFARCQEPRKMRLLYLAIVGGVVVFSLLILGAAGFFPLNFFLFSATACASRRELFLMVTGTVVSVVAGTLWALNASKAWVSGSGSTSLTLATRIALIPTDFQRGWSSDLQPCFGPAGCSSIWL